MTTTKLYSNKTRFWNMYRSALKRLLPFALVTAISSFMLIPLVFFASLPDHTNRLLVTQAQDAAAWAIQVRAYYMDVFKGIYISEAQLFFVPLVLGCIAVATAIFSNSYTQSKKQTDFYHSLPIPRPQLLGANLLASLSAILVPFSVIYLGTFAAQMIGYARYGSFTPAFFQYVAVELIGLWIYVCVVYVFTTFVAVQVGTVFDTLCLTGALGILPLTVFLISGNLWASYTYGATFERFNIQFPLYSPFTFYFDKFINTSFYSSEFYASMNYTRHFIVLLSWLAIGVALFVGSIILYNRRKSEVAEQTQPAGILQIIVKLFAAFLGSVLLLLIFEDRSIPVRLIAIFAGALLVGVMAELVLSRGVKSLGKNLKLLAIGGAVFCLLALSIFYDWAGYSKKVPSPEKVKSVSVSYNGRYTEDYTYNMQGNESSYSANGWYGENEWPVLTDRKSIDVVVAMHQKTTENQPNKRMRNWDSTGYTWETVDLVYTLSSGAKMKRSYSTIDSEAYAMLSKLEEQDDFIQGSFPIFEIEPANVQYIRLQNALGETTAPNLRLQEDEVKLLLNAIHTDMIAEPWEIMANPQSPAVGYIELYSLPQENAGYIPGARLQYQFVLVSENYKDTIAALKQLGLYEKISTKSAIQRVQITQPAYLHESDRIVLVRPSGADRYNPVYEILQKYAGEDNYSEDYPDENYFWVETEDPEEIEELLKNARHSLYSDEDTFMENYVCITPMIDNAILYTLYLPVDKLPAAYRAKLDEYHRTQQLEREEYEENDTTEAQPAFVTVETTVAQEIG